MVFAWRLLRERLPTKDNLLTCSILHHDNQLCVGGYGMEETTNHQYLSCHIFGISEVDPMSLTGHFLQFGQLGGNHGRLRSTLILIWLTCT